LIAFLGAQVVPGAEYVLGEVEAGSNLSRATAAVTGEGRLDMTSFFGKAPVEFARRAKEAGVPVAGVFGGMEERARQKLAGAGIGAAASLGEAGATPAQAMKQAARWAAKAAALAIKRLLLASALLGLVQAANAAPKDLVEADRLYWHRDQGKNLEEGVKRLEELLKERPDDPALLWRRGRGLVRLGEQAESKKEKLKVYEDAEACLKRAVELGPKDADAHYWLGVAMGRRGQTRGVLKSLFLVGPIRAEMRETILLDPKHGGAHHLLGEILMELPGFAGGSKKKALREFEEAARLWPDFAVNLVSLSEAYAALGRKDEARQALRKVLEIKEPVDPAEYPENAKDAREELSKLGG
jgi:tetratricopeptide (TPR) repeat protein